MLGLPKSTEFDKRIPKQKFYEKLEISPEIRRMFVEQIRVIYWRNKITPSTVNLTAGTQVDELEVLEIRLNTPELHEDVLRLIDREIPYHILFLLAHEGKYRAAIGYKEKAGTGKNAFRVERYYYTGWTEEGQLALHMDGLSMDAVYENFVRQIAGEALAPTSGGAASLQGSIELQKRREQLQKQIDALEAKIRREKQPKKKYELVQKLRVIQDKLRS